MKNFNVCQKKCKKAIQLDRYSDFAAVYQTKIILNEGQTACWRKIRAKFGIKENKN